MYTRIIRFAFFLALAALWCFPQVETVYSGRYFMSWDLIPIQTVTSRIFITDAGLWGPRYTNARLMPNPGFRAFAGTVRQNASIMWPTQILQTLLLLGLLCGAQWVVTGSWPTGALLAWKRRTLERVREWASIRFSN
jgi:hypothetical protein